MKLTIKDQDFLDKLKSLLESKDLAIEMKNDGLKRLVLRKNYGDKIESCFNMTRQGIRWRFQRLFNEFYLNAYLSIFWIESNFGTQLRKMVIEIARERIALRKKALQQGQSELYRRQDSGK